MNIGYHIPTSFTLDRGIWIERLPTNSNLGIWIERDDTAIHVGVGRWRIVVDRWGVGAPRAGRQAEPWRS